MVTATLSAGHRPPPPGGDGGAACLNGVGAASSADAWAAGAYLPELAATQTVILHWTGTKWARTAALAVGGADYPRNVRKLLIERWNGMRWKPVPVPNPTP